MYQDINIDRCRLHASAMTPIHHRRRSTDATPCPSPGIGPELINGRLAMIGFVAALGAELSSGEPVLRQWASEPTGIASAFLLVIAGSLVPFLQGNKNTEAFGALTPAAEMNNGRAAMIGFASLLIAEFATSGKALF
jgi:hypothetical protein